MTRAHGPNNPPEGWRAHPLLTREAIAYQWKHWQLHLRVWAMPDGMHVLSYIERMGDAGRLEHRTIARAVWRPSGVTERDVVEWGQRALAAWLAAGEDRSAE